MEQITPVPTTNKVTSWLALLALAMTLIACGGSSEYATSVSVQPGAPAVTFSPEAEESWGAPQALAERRDSDMSVNPTSDWSGTDTLTFPGERRIIRTAEIDLETAHMADTREALQDLVTEAGGFIETADLTQSPDLRDSSRGDIWRATYVLRVPVAQFDWVSAQITHLGTVTHQHLSSRDVTAQFYDAQRRLALREQEYIRLTYMREHATDLEELLDLERRISQVRLAMERYGRQAQDIDQAAAFSTLWVRLYEPYQAPVPFGVDDGFGTRFVQGLGQSVGFTVNVLQWMVLVLASLVVPLTALAMPVGLILGLKKMRHQKMSDG